MKKIYVVFCLFVLFSCKTTVKKPVNFVYLSGTITNPQSEVITIWKGSETDTAFLDQNNNFNIRMKVTEPDYYTFYHGNKMATLFFVPGDSFSLSLNTLKFDESLNFVGNGADINNYIARKFMLNEELSANFEQLFSLEKEQFIAQTDSNFKAKTDNFKEFLSSNKNVDSEFRLLEEGSLLYEWASNRQDYPMYHKYLTEKDTLELGDDYDNYLSKLDFNNEELLKLDEYYYFLLAHLNNLAADKYQTVDSIKNHEHGHTLAKFIEIKSTFTAQKIREKFLYNALNDHIKYYSINNIEVLLNDFRDNCSNEEYISEIQESLIKWEKLLKGNPAPDFSYPDIKNNIVSLSDFRGKYVYIDVWATWCGPYMGELPYLEKLEEEFEGKNVVFISVSIDNTPDPWGKMIKEKQMKGVQLYADKAWESAIIKNYLISGIPRFILVDRDGNILNVKAPRPSGIIKDVLENLEGIE